MLENVENKALRSLQFFLHICINADKPITFEPKLVNFFRRNTNFTRLYFPHFTTLHNQTLPLYKFYNALYNCADRFRCYFVPQKFRLLWELSIENGWQRIKDV